MDTHADTPSVAALADALEADDRAAVAAHGAAAVEIINQYRLAAGSTMDAAAVHTPAAPRPFQNAMTIDALMEELKAARPPGRGAGAVAPAVLAAHSTQTSPPSQEDWNINGQTMAMVTKYAAALHAKNAAERNVLRPAPPTLTDVDVAQALTTQYAAIPSCLFGAQCSCATKLCNGDVMRRHYAPAEWMHWTITGTLTEPMKERQPCYLDQLVVATTTQTAAPHLNAEAIVLPFVHCVDVPGGYRRDAMHASAEAMVSHGVTGLMRAANLAEYRVATAEVYEPQLHDPATGLAVQWSPVEVTCLVESAAVLAGPPVPVDEGGAARPVFLAPKVRRQPPACEELLAAKYVPADALVPADFSAVVALSVRAAEAARGVVPLEQAYGCLRPTGVHLPAAAADADGLRRALAFCSLHEARARLFSVVLEGGAPSCARLLRAGCLPSTFRRREAASPLAFSCAARGVAETPDAVLAHSVLFALLLRINVIETLEPTRRLKTYTAALQPLYSYMCSATQPTALSDAALFRLHPQNEALIPYAALYPRPAPIYFEPEDIEAHARSSGTPKLCKIDQPEFGRKYFASLRPAHQALAGLVPDSLFAAAWQRADTVCGPALLPALEWVAGRSDRAGVRAPLALASAPDTSAALAQAIEIGSRETLVWTTVTLRLAMLYAALDELPPEPAGGAGLGQTAAAAIREACAAGAARGVVSVADDVLPRVAAALRPGQAPGTPATAARDYAKRMLYAHIRLCVALLEAGAVLDSECDPVVTHAYQTLELHDGEYAVPLPVGLARQFARDSWGLEPPPAVVALQDALPTPMLRAIDLARALATARAASDDFATLSALAVHAALGGYLPGARTVAAPGRLAELYQSFVAAGAGGRRAALAALDGPTDMLCMRRYVAALMACAPELALTTMYAYDSVPEWRAQLDAQLDAVRGGAAPGDVVRVVPRPNARGFCNVLLAATQEAIEQVFAEPAARRAMVPPPATVAAIEAYAAELPRGVPFDPEWLAQVGVQRPAVDAVARLYRDACTAVCPQLASVAEGVMWEVCTVLPRDAALCYCFALLWRRHRARAVVRLDRETTARQLYALGGAAPYPAYVTSAACCDRICNYTAQHMPAFTGVYGVSTRAAADVAPGHTLYHCIKRRPRGAGGSKDAPTLAECYAMPCGAPLRAVLAVGFALEHRGAGADAAPGYTLCPRCGRGTAVAPALIGPGGLACGTCDTAERDAARRVGLAPAALRCCVCSALGPDAIRVARRMNVMACVTRVRIVDDRLIERHAVVRDALVCSLCYKPWILPALREGHTLGQVLDALEHNTHRAVGYDELANPPCDAAFRAGAQAFLAGAADDDAPAYPPEALSFADSLVSARPRDAHSVARPRAARGRRAPAVPRPARPGRE